MTARLLRAVAMLVVGLGLFVGLPLLAWGVTDLRGFLADPVRLGYLLAAAAAQVAIVATGAAAGASARTGPTTVRRQHWALVLLQVLSLGIVLTAPYTDRHTITVLPGGDVLRALGLGAFALGILGTQWAATTLGRQFSVEVTIQRDHQLVTSGPYRLLRHPRYLAILCCLGGIALVFRSGVALVLAGLLALVLVWRIHDEEALLRREFGAAWEAYARGTWRLLPFVY